MCCTKVSGCILWCFLVPVVGALYLCEGPNDLAAEWPTEQELRNFNETTEGVSSILSINSHCGHKMIMDDIFSFGILTNKFMEV